MEARLGMSPNEEKLPEAPTPVTTPEKTVAKEATPQETPSQETTPQETTPVKKETEAKK
jgi:hypothetical protein